MMKDQFIEVNGKTLLLDKNGYLANMDDWTKDVAVEFARIEQIEMSQQHWDIVIFVRDFYENYETSPAIRALVNALKQQYGPEVGNSRYLQRLFPNGPAKLASKLAGLPKPAKCL